MSNYGKSADLKAKAERLEKLKREKMLRDAVKVKEEHDKQSTAAKNEQDALSDILKKASKYAEKAKEEEREEQIKKKLEKQIENSPIKKTLSNTVANFLGEITIPPKVKFAMYDKPVQAGDDDIAVGFEPSEPHEEIPPASSSPQQFRPVFSQIYPQKSVINPSVKKDLESARKKSDANPKNLEESKGVGTDPMQSASKSKTPNALQGFLY